MKTTGPSSNIQSGNEVPLPMQLAGRHAPKIGRSSTGQVGQDLNRQQHVKPESDQAAQQYLSHCGGPSRPRCERCRLQLQLQLQSLLQSLYLHWQSCDCWLSLMSCHLCHAGCTPWAATPNTASVDVQHETAAHITIRPPNPE